MEGPTPVSALIHAATMVTAGVFLIIRCSPLFEYAPKTLIIITFMGGFTAFMAATIGLVQLDLKKVFAYSTCSQLGYMVFSCGIKQQLQYTRGIRNPGLEANAATPRSSRGSPAHRSKSLPVSPRSSRFSVCGLIIRDLGSSSARRG